MELADYDDFHRMACPIPATRVPDLPEDGMLNRQSESRSLAHVSMEGFRMETSDLDRSFVSASHSGTLDRVEELLCLGANINARDEEGTALMLASRAGHLPVVRLLLTRKAQVDAVNWAGQTAVIFAAANGHEAVVAELLLRGANRDFVDTTGKDARAWAEQKGHARIVAMLVASESSVGIEDVGAVLALQKATESGDVSRVLQLLDQGVGVDATIDDGKVIPRTALLWACEARQVEAARALLDRGANVNWQDRFGYTPLLIAAHEECLSQDRLPLVQLLLERGANVNYARASYRETALHLAASGCNPALVRFLLDHRADSLAADWFDKTPLQLAQQGLPLPGNTITTPQVRAAKHEIVAILEDSSRK